MVKNQNIIPNSDTLVPNKSILRTEIYNLTIKPIFLIFYNLSLQVTFTCNLLAIQ